MIEVKEGKRIMVTCECGCGKQFHKQANKVRASRHHFLNPRHYYHWMKRHKRNASQLPLNKIKFYAWLRELDEAHEG